MLRLFRRLRAILFGQKLDRDIDRELAAHLEMAGAARARSGADPDDARRLARRELGDPIRIREEIHDARGLTTWDALRQDVRFAFRSLRRSPGFTTAAIVVLGLGIGANAAMFSVLDGVLLKPLPFRDGDQLMLVQHAAPASNVADAGVSINELYDYRDRLRSVTDLVEYHSMSFTLLDQGDPDRVDTGVVSANFFDMLGIVPHLGRTFQQGDDALGAEPVLVLSHRYWQQKFGGDPDVVGRSVQMNNFAHTIVGVLPDFPEYPRANDVYMPTSACPFRAQSERNMAQSFRSFSALRVFGRIAPHATVAAAGGEVAGLAASFATDHAGDYQTLGGFTGGVRPLQDQLTAEARPMLWALLGTTLLVLVLACANVANLSIGRTMRRERELAVRAALGAGRGRLARQLITESVLVALAGGLVGLAFAYGSIDLLASFVSRFTPRTGQIAIDGGVLLFALVASVLTGIVFGAAPAFAARRSVMTSIRDGSAQSGETSRRQRMRAGLVVAQVAVSFMLLVGAALLVKSFYRLSTVPIGFKADSIVTAAIFGNFTRMSSGADIARINESILERLRASPAVAQAAVTSVAPFTAVQPVPRPIEIEGRSSPDGPPTPANQSVASDGYFETLGVPLLAGRAFRTSDDGEAPPVAVINRSMAAYWQGADPVGTRFRRAGANTPWFTVVGIAEDFKLYAVDEEIAAHFYVPFRWAVANGGGAGRLLVQAAGDPADLPSVIREAVRAVDPEIPVEEMQTLEELKTGTLSVPRLTAALLVMFAGVALAVTLAGLAGLVGTSVSQRTREFGLRMALGASRGSVLRLVMGQSTALVAAGLALGAVGAVVFSQLMAQFLFATPPHDVLSYVGVAALFVAASAVAALAPARRATTVHPLTALKTD